MRNPPQETELTALKNVKLFQLDVTDRQSIAKAYEAIRMEYWTVDVLLNNAGYALFGPLELSTEDRLSFILFRTFLKACSFSFSVPVAFTGSGNGQ